MLLENLILPGRGTNNRFDVEISDSDHKITKINPALPTSNKSPPSRVIPTLCHPHIHLDKPFLLTAHNTGPGLPDYSDLAPQDGTFAEALANTSAAKERYTHDDLIRRGSQLIVESIQAGVTSMRAFVEVDRVTKLKCVKAGVELKKKYESQCHVQLCVFAQDPIFDEDKDGPENRQWVEKALNEYAAQIEVVGSTPYVEGSDELQKRNVDWAVEVATKHHLHLDFHLDYNLDENSEPILWHVIDVLKNQNFPEMNPEKTVVIGHCSRMTLFNNSDMHRLAGLISDNKLPFHFGGLPTSDIFMMGRPKDENWGGQRPRGSLQVLSMMKQFGLKPCISINNVGNAFTPWGNLDPLRLASLGVGLYQAGTPRDAELLFECVSALAQEAIGLSNLVVRSIEEGNHALFMVISNDATISINGQDTGVPARQRLSVADIVWDPPEMRQRRIVGRVPDI